LNDLIINFTPTGMIPTKKQTPFVPVTPSEIISDVKEACALGITMVHLHVRDDDGAPHYDKEVYKSIITGIRDFASDLVICVSTSGRIYSDLDKRADVLLLDISLPDGNGIDLCPEIKAQYPDLKILMLTSYSELSIIMRVLENGASGYILKNALSEEIITGIETVMEGETFLCDEIDILMKKRADQQIWLTAREKELLKLIVDGFTNQEMADKMFLSIETIKTYRKNLILKLDAKNSMVLVKMALENGWV